MSESTPQHLRGALVRAARAELDQGGSAGLSLRAVARRAGLSHAAPAYAFGDRAGLLTAVAAQGFDELAQEMDRPAADGGRADLAELGRRYVAFAAANPALYEVMFGPGRQGVDDAGLQEARGASLRALTRATRPDGADHPPVDLTRTAWALAHGTASLAAQGALDPATADATVETFAALAHP